ncbi:MAG: class I SAM-dependent methyltransferase [Pseudomonadota bacterium]
MSDNNQSLDELNDNDTLLVSNFIIRQDRFEVLNENYFLKIGNDTYEVINYSSFGLAILHSEVFSDSFDQIEAEFLMNNVLINKPLIKLIRQEKYNDERYLIAFELLSEALSIERISFMGDVEKLIKKNCFEDNKWRELPLEYKIKVFELKDYLYKLKNEIDLVEAENNSSDRQECLSEFNKSFVSVFSKLLYNQISYFCSGIFPILNKLDEEKNKEAFSFFHEHLKSFINKSKLASKSFKKSSNHVGDHELFSLIYSKELFSQSLFDQCIESFFINLPEAEGFRERIEYFNNWLIDVFNKNEKQDLKILSVVSGSAIELNNLLRSKQLKLKYPLEIHCIDQDLNALKQAQATFKELQLGKEAMIKFIFIQKNISSIISAKFTDDNYDYIYSVGLFDYLSDPVASLAAVNLLKYLKEDGELVIGNSSYEANRKLEMIFLLKWYIVHRTEKDLLKLFKKITKKLHIEPSKDSKNNFVFLKRK